MKRLHISMGYTYVGDTGIDIPDELLKGKTEEEQLQIAYEYAQDHIDEIPVALNAEYIPNSDCFEIDDIDFEEDSEKLTIDQLLELGEKTNNVKLASEPKTKGKNN